MSHMNYKGGVLFVENCLYMSKDVHLFELHTWLYICFRQMVPRTRGE